LYRSYNVNDDTGHYNVYNCYNSKYYNRNYDVCLNDDWHDRKYDDR
jgi:hypothetical protein